MSQSGNDPHQRERGRIKLEGLSLKPRLEKEEGGEKEVEHLHFDEMIEMNHPPLPPRFHRIPLYSYLVVSSFSFNSNRNLLKLGIDSAHGENATVSTSPSGAVAPRMYYAVCRPFNLNPSSLPLLKHLRPRIRQWMFISNVK